MKPSTMSPVRLRLILMSALTLLAIAGVGMFTFGHSKLKEFSRSAQETATLAASSNSSLQGLQSTKTQLEKQSEVIERASLIVAESQSYLYQDQIITDINRLAQNAGIGITNITFGSVTSTGVTGGAAAAADTPATPTVSEPDAATGSRADAGTSGATAPVSVKSMTATITLVNPIPYPKMLTFIHSIEQSLTKMRISTIGLSKATDGDSKGGVVTSDTLTIEVYVR